MQLLIALYSKVNLEVVEVRVKLVVVVFRLHPSGTCIAAALAVSISK